MLTFLFGFCLGWVLIGCMLFNQNKPNNIDRAVAMLGVILFVILSYMGRIR